MNLPSGLAKARSRLRGSPLGFSLSSPHQHDIFSLSLKFVSHDFGDIDVIAFTFFPARSCNAQRI